MLDGDEGRHAARVKRLGPGELVLVADGRGARAECVIDSVDGDTVLLSVRSRGYEPEPEPRLVVVQALPKGDRGELSVEVLTELGVDEIVPWAAARSIAQWRDQRGAKALQKWRRTAREAAKQSRRPRVPVVAELAATAAVAQRLAGAAAGFVLHEAASDRLACAPLPTAGALGGAIGGGMGGGIAGEIVLVVGPEGGISPDELAAFGAARVVRLGDAVLRTSTAGAAALAVVQSRLGRWG